MNLPKLFAVVASLHVVIVGALLVQPGCQSVSETKPTVVPNGPMDSERSISNRPLSPDINQGIAPASAEVSSVQQSEMRMAPTRPTWDMNAHNTQAYEDSQPLQSLTQPGALASTVSSYTVQKGDSLWAISQRTGISVADLATANGLSRKANLKVGQVLTIPDKDAAQLAGNASSQNTALLAVDMSQKTSEYMVRSGDSLSKIANRSGTTVATLKSINGLTSDSIRVGQKLILPEKSNSTVKAVKNTSSAPKAIEHEVQYTVQPGDTLSGIASRFGLKASDIMAWNNIQEARQLRAGQALVLEGGQTAKSPSTQKVPSSSSASEPADASEETPPEVVPVDDFLHSNVFDDTAGTEDDDMAMDAADDVSVVPIDHDNS